MFWHYLRRLQWLQQSVLFQLHRYTLLLGAFTDNWLINRTVHLQHDTCRNSSNSKDKFVLYTDSFSYKSTASNRCSIILNVVQDIVTRWWSTCAVPERLLHRGHGPWVRVRYIPVNLFCYIPVRVSQASTGLLSRTSAQYLHLSSKCKRRWRERNMSLSALFRVWSAASSLQLYAWQNYEPD